MAALYDVIDTVNKKTVMKDRTAHEIAKKFGMLPGNIRRYSDLKYLLRKRYLVVNTYNESKSDFADFKERWDDAVKPFRIAYKEREKVKKWNTQ
jgi:hypothetical protein